MWYCVWPRTSSLPLKVENILSLSYQEECDTFIDIVLTTMADHNLQNGYVPNEGLYQSTHLDL